jgi:hypothetical protein
MLPLSLFFVNIASKGLSVGVSPLESTVAGGCVSVDSEGLEGANGMGISGTGRKGLKVCRLEC